jgi:carbon monoxide dehydrogenase subunit G
MKLEQSFEVAAPLDRVWEALIDVERVAPCLPGAAVTGRNEDGSYDGTFKVKIGPTSASYAGKLHMEQIDESVHTATMQAQGTDKRGQGGAKATIVSSLAAAGEGATRVDVSTDYHITGRLARFGRGGMIEDISNRLLGEFAKCLQTNLAGAPEGEAGDAADAAANGDVAVAAVAADGGDVAAAGVPATAGGAEEAGAEAAAAEAAGAEEAGAEAAGAEAAGAEEVAEAGAEAVAEAGVASEALGEGTRDPEPVGSPPADSPSASSRPPGDSASASSRPPADSASASSRPPADSASASSRPPFTPAPESEPVQGLSLVGGALFRQAKQNPAPVVALLLGFLLALRVLRRRG